MIERFKEHGIKENTNLFLPHIHLRKNTGTGIRQLEYSQIIRSLMYCTKLDITYAVSKLSRYTSNPSDGHWIALLRVIGYASNIKEYTLRYENYSLVFEDNSYANLIAHSEKLKSTSGYIFIWKISKIPLLIQEYTYPLVDFDSSKSAIQLASLYPSSTGDTVNISRHSSWYVMRNLILVVKQSNDHHWDY